MGSFVKTEIWVNICVVCQTINKLSRWTYAGSAEGITSWFLLCIAVFIILPIFRSKISSFTEYYRRTPTGLWPHYFGEKASARWNLSECELWCFFGSGFKDLFVNSFIMNASSAKMFSTRNKARLTSLPLLFKEKQYKSHINVGQLLIKYY